jgi:hypothetical protein
MFLLDLAPPVFWLEPVAPTKVSATLVVCCYSTSSISVKALITWPSAIGGKVWVDGSGMTSSPGHERC